VHLAEGLVELAERGGDTGSCTRTGGGACSWYELAVEIFDRAGPALPRPADHVGSLPAARAAPGVLRARQRARRGAVLPPWQDGVAGYLSERAVVAR
jgi:dTDP-4-dehydrorhamnose reductase